MKKIIVVVLYMCMIVGTLLLTRSDMLKDIVVPLSAVIEISIGFLLGMAAICCRLLD